ncbi:MAG: tetratricopeptide repeat protein [Cyclobacteriaceae bacterium]|nr:tetratricopeptide repeat protein [Cyclobacteriaceae bacterium]
MKTLTFLLITLVVSSVNYLSAQTFRQAFADSLYTELQKNDNGTLQADLYNQLARLYYDQDIKKSLTFGDSALRIASRNKYSKGIKEAQNILQRVNQRMGIYSTAFEYTLDNLIRTEHDMDTAQMLDSYITMGNINSNMENYGEAQLYFHKALALAQKSRSTQQANIMNYIGRAHGKLMRFDSAEHWIKRALRLEILQPQPGATLAYIYNNLGEIHLYQKEYDSALFFYNQAALDSARTNLYGRTFTLIGLAQIYHAQQQPEKAIAALEASLAISLKNSYRDKTREAYGLLYPIYEERGEFKKAFDYYRLFVTYRDSVFNASLTQYIENQNISLENESLRRETELKDSRLRQQRLMLWMIALAALLTIPLAFSLLYAYRLRTRSNNLLRNYNHDLKNKVQERTQELTKTNIELARHNNQLEEYQFITAHNLRGPVARILGLINIINGNSFQWPRDKEVVDKLTQATVDLDNIVHDLSHVLHVKRVGTSTYEPVILSKRVLRIKSTLKDLILDSGTVFQEDYTQVDTISTIPTYIESILYNLIANAIKFRSPERKPVVTIKTFASENQVAIHIRDNGLGIDLPLVRDKLYGLYQRFHTHVEGRGLGLYLVKAQVDALSGSIEIESAPDKGTTFRIRFPRNS